MDAPPDLRPGCGSQEARVWRWLPPATVILSGAAVGAGGGAPAAETTGAWATLPPPSPPQPASNGAATVKTDPAYDKVLGILKIYAVGAGTLTEVAQADSGHWCQGATWSDDGRVILQQCATERAILVYRFDGQALVQDKAATMTFESRPGAIATQHSR